MKSVLKKIRIENCLSQEELSAISKVSIKTIQRIENGQSKGSTYSIKQLATALKIEPILLQHEELGLISKKQIALPIIKLINWSALAVILIPIANIILPLIIIYKTKDNDLVSKIGKKIVSVQILWTFFSLVAVTLLPLLYLAFTEQTYSGGVPMFIPIYFITVLINVIIILTIAYRLSNSNEYDFWLPNLL